MSRISILIFLFFFSFCIAHPPKKPDQPLPLFKSLLDIQKIGEETTPPPTTPTAPPVIIPNISSIADTGQTQCWDTTGILIGCGGTGQDGDYTNIPRPRSFTGPTQHPIFNNDYTTIDNVHGLTWQSCNQGRSGANCLGGVSNSINWNTANAGGAGSCIDLNFQNAGLGYAGITNWRIPTAKELLSLLYYANAPIPVYMETIPFPNPDTTNLYMSNTDFNTNNLMIWVIDFLSPGFPRQPFVRTANALLRCVSGNITLAFTFVDNGDGTISDQNTNLLWSKCVAGRSGANCLTGIASNVNWQTALNTCNTLNLGGRTGWRLPNMNELLSIVDETGGGTPVASAIFFPNNPLGALWTSTTESQNTNLALYISFFNGQMVSMNKTNPGNFRCVTPGP